MPLLRSAIGRGSLRLTHVDVVVDVGVCYVSVAVLGETDSTAICQLRSQIDVARFSGKLRRQQPRLYSATSIIGCGASQYAAIKNTIRRKLPTDNI